MDCFWPEARLVVEVDGFAYHSSRDSFEGDRRRDADLEARGIRVVRVTWRQITRERTATAARIGGALGSAAVAPGIRSAPSTRNAKRLGHAAARKR